MRISHTFSAAFFCTVLGAQAATPSLGFISAQGSFQLNNSRIWGNATLFDGSVIETGPVPSRIHLNNGSEIRLAAGTRAGFFQGRATLEKGSMRLQSSAAYQVDARTLHLSAGEGNTVAIVALQNTQSVSASATSGHLLVTNPGGVLVAEVKDGRGVSLTPESAGDEAVTRITGCLVYQKKAVVLIDEASGVSFLVRGGGVGLEVGNRIVVSGTAQSRSPKTPGAAQEIVVAQLTRLAAGVCTPDAAAHTGPLGKVAGGITAAVGGLVGVAGTAGAVAIIGGVAVAGTTAWLDAAGAFTSSQAEAQPETSR